MDKNDIGREVVDSAIAVHREFGQGLLESVCEVVLLDELMGYTQTVNGFPK